MRETDKAISRQMEIGTGALATYKLEPTDTDQGGRVSLYFLLLFCLGKRSV